MKLQIIYKENVVLYSKISTCIFKNEPTYKRLYKNVWLLKDVPEKYGIPKKI